MSKIAEINKKINQINLLASFKKIAKDYGSVWLDSSLSFEDRGRFSIIARDPIGSVSLCNNEIVLKQFNQQLVIKAPGQIFEYLEQYWKDPQYISIGYFSYESSLNFLKLGHLAATENLVPEINFLIYDSALIYDHLLDEINATNPDLDDYSDMLTTDISVIHKPKSDTATVLASLTKAEYLEKIKKIKGHIKEGDIYQANFTTRFEVESATDPFEVYKKLRELNPAPYSAYMNLGDYNILSSSPERMFKKDGDSITTGPIKGTVELGNSEKEIMGNKQRLLDSDKDKAELLMIVDLERNDLGKIAKTGSVEVETLFKPEIYSSLIHLVSDIKAKLPDDIEYTDIIQAMLPGGSITGAPKKRAVEIIQSLETVPRSIYTGSIGYIWDNKADFNIAIRTILHKDKKYYIHAGGGIVADSQAEAEYNEMLLKAKNLFKAVGVVNKCNW